MLRNLHLLRVIAALGVVYFHTTSSAGLNLAWDVGSRGVDVFFVISGFIIAYIGLSKPEHFIQRRLIRVVPFYWAATLVVFLAATIAPRFFRSTDASLTHLVASLFFIPHTSATGEMQPTLILGWSLNFEMYFYVLFALALQVSRRWSPLICVAWIVSWVVAINSMGVTNPIAAFFARPTVLEFCFGIAAYYLCNWCESRRTLLAQRRPLKWLLIVVLTASAVALVVLEKYYRDVVPRYLVGGIPAFFLVTSALLLERVFGIVSHSRLSYLLGESSYVIYLIHPYVVFTILRIGLHDPTSLSLPFMALLIVGLLALTSALSLAMHLYFEKPVMAFLRAKLLD